MKRMMLVAALFGLCIPGFASAQLKSAKNPTRTSTGRLQIGGKKSPIRALLLKHVDSVNFDETTFREVLDWVRDQSTEHGKVNVIAQWRALAVESIDEESPVTLQMEDTTVAEVLDEALDQLSDLDPLTYVGIRNNLKVSTASDFDRKLYTRVYNVDDIFFEIKNFFGSPQIDLNQQQQGGGGGGGGQGGQAQVQSIFGNSGGGGGNDDNNENDEEDEERGEEIMEWIRATVEPNTWEENGGFGTMDVFNKNLVIRNTLKVHETIGGPFHIDK